MKNFFNYGVIVRLSIQEPCFEEPCFEAQNTADEV